MESTQVIAKNKAKVSHRLEIVFADARGNQHQHTFLMFEAIKAKDEIDFNINDIVSLKATGKALQTIKAQYSTKIYKGGNIYSIPVNMFKEDEMTWYGDIAKTILANL